MTVAKILDLWELAAVVEQHPFALSQGRKRRLALVLLAEDGRWPVLILDEPTAGLDARIPMRRLLALMVPFALFGFGVFTTSLLFSADSGFAVQMAREQGGAPEIMPGLVLFVRALACGMASAVFALTPDPGQFTRALMQHLHLPAPMGSALMHAMHLLPDFSAEMLRLPQLI